MADETNELLFGLCRATTIFLIAAVKQGALDREKTLKEFAAFRKGLTDSGADQATDLWMGHMIEALEADPSRPPPAPVLQFPRRPR